MEVAGRATSTHAVDEEGHSGRTKANNNEWAKGDETTSASRGKKSMEHTYATNVEAETAADGAATIVEAQARESRQREQGSRTKWG
jgi:hypothetical protein